MSHETSRKRRDPSPSSLRRERSIAKSPKKSKNDLGSPITSQSPQHLSTAVSSVTVDSRNEPTPLSRAHTKSSLETQPRGTTLGLELRLSHQPKPSSKCFRISNVPPTWSQADILTYLKSVDGSFDLSATDHRLSLYPACSGRSQVALLNLMECSNYFQQLEPHRSNPLGNGDPGLTIDSHFYGLTPLNDPDGNTIADVVAVTGLGGHAFGSWRNRTSDRMWLQDFLPQEINCIRIMTYGYDTTLTGPNASKDTMLDHRRALVSHLENARCSPEEKTRPIIFIGHSMGGILILQALLQCKLQSVYNELLDATHTICFFGTPHQGLEGADIEAMVNRMSTTPQIKKLLFQLRESSDFLEHLSDGFGDILVQRKVISFYETKETPSIIMSSDTGNHSRDGPLKEMVKKVSSLLRLPNERRIPVARNHTDIVKFHDQSDPTYRTVIAHIQKCIDATVRSPTRIGVRLEAAQRSEILEWISSIPYTSHHRHISESRLHGTGQWVFERKEYRDWITSPTSMLLLLRGIPGAGKTYIASRVIDSFLQLESPYAEKFAYFYCNRAEENRSQPVYVLNTLIQQLAQTAAEADTLLTPVVDLYAVREKEGQKSSRLSLREAQELLVRLTDIYPRTTICIDALDEVKDESRIHLLKSLKYVVERSKKLVKIFATTRMDPDILRQFERFPKIELQPDDNVSDINQFVENKVQSAIDDGLLLDGDVGSRFKAEICDVLCKRTKGMFQLAALQITFLCKMPTQNDVRQSLKVLPDTLMEAYDKIYQRILTQKGSARQLALSAFRWIQSSYEPLQSETLLDAITVEIGCSGEFSRNNTVNANNLLKVCQNLLILDESLNVFRLAHLSVDEYLETKLPKIASHTESARVCLSLLCNPHYWNKYDRTLSTSEGDYEDRHLLLYSTTFWPWHFSHCEAANDTMEILSQKFMSETNYRNWLLYHRSVVRVDPWTRDPFWRKIAAFVEHENDAPIFSACVFGLTRTFEVLKSRMDVDAAWLSGLLADASNFGYLEIARLLIDGGADVSAADDVKLTPLHCASYTGHQAIARLLIDRGANVSAAKNDGRTPLHLALESRHEAIARLLIESGANVSAADEDGATPLRMAVANGDEAVVWLLINRGAEVSATDEDGGTPLHLAARYGREAVARLLIDCGADVSAADDYGCTPVHHALGSGHEAVARLLIDGGADILATDEYSLSPLHHASDSGDDGMSRLLRDRGSIWRQLTATPTPTSSL